MRVGGINLKAFYVMLQDDVVPVIGKRRLRIDVSDRAVGGGHDGVGWLAVFVALQAADVQTLVQLPAVAPHATEATGRPRLVCRADEKLFFAAVFKERGVGGGQTKRLRTDERHGERQPGDKDAAVKQT